MYISVRSQLFILGKDDSLIWKYFYFFLGIKTGSLIEHCLNPTILEFLLSKFLLGNKMLATVCQFSISNAKALEWLFMRIFSSDWLISWLIGWFIDWQVMKHAGKNQAGLFWETFFEDILKITLSLKRKISRMMHWIFVLWTVKTAYVWMT